MRIPLWVAAGLGVLGVGFTGGYYLALWQQGQYQALLAGAAIIAFLAWLGSGADLLGLLRELYRDRKEAEEKRKQRLRKHIEILNEQVYKRLHIFIRPGNRGKEKHCMIPLSNEEYRRYMAEFVGKPFWDYDKIPDPILIPYNKLPFLERGISHMKHPSYQTIYSAWTKLHALLEEHNKLTKSLDNELIPTIRGKMQDSFPAFTDGDSDTASVLGNVYYSTLISRFITQYVLSLLAAQRTPSFENSLQKRKEEQSSRWHITGNGLIPLIFSVTEIELEKLQIILLAIIREGDIMKKIQRMHEIDTEIGESIRTFEVNLQELINDIDEPENDYLLRANVKNVRIGISKHTQM